MKVPKGIDDEYCEFAARPFSDLATNWRTARGGIFAISETG